MIAALYAAAIVAAVLTSANAMLISSSVVFSNDFYKALHPNVSDKSLVRVSKLYIFASCMVGYVLVRFIPGVISYIMLTYTISTCLVVALYGGLLFKAPTPMSGILSLTFSIVSALTWEVMKTPSASTPYSSHCRWACWVCCLEC